jgi:hypothetical protein
VLMSGKRLPGTGPFTMRLSGTRFISGPSSALKKLAGALHTDAVRSTLSFGREVKMEIPANNSSHLYLATHKSSRMDVERGGIP